MGCIWVVQLPQDQFWKNRIFVNNHVIAENVWPLKHWPSKHLVEEWSCNLEHIGFTSKRRIWAEFCHKLYRRIRELDKQHHSMCDRHFTNQCVLYEFPLFLVCPLELTAECIDRILASGLTIHRLLAINHLDSTSDVRRCAMPTASILLLELQDATLCLSALSEFITIDWRHGETQRFSPQDESQRVLSSQSFFINPYPKVNATEAVLARMPYSWVLNRWIIDLRRGNRMHNLNMEFMINFMKFGIDFQTSAAYRPQQNWAELVTIELMTRYFVQVYIRKGYDPVAEITRNKLKRWTRLMQITGKKPELLEYTQVLFECACYHDNAIISENGFTNQANLWPWCHSEFCLLELTSFQDRL